VWREKKMAGRTYMGTVRTTFSIDEQGVVTHIIEKVNTKDSANQILEIVNS
jgi:peroxiredoxin Q/BCP